GGHTLPLQSIPSSSPFCTPSLQLSQGGQMLPPQSVPVSSWFWIPSLHVSHAPQSVAQMLHVSPVSQVPLPQLVPAPSTYTRRCSVLLCPSASSTNRLTV